MEQTLPKENVLVGKEIFFGKYKQDADSDDMVPIQWRICAMEDNKALLRSEHALEVKPYHSERIDITWEDCDLRKWLNTDFINIAFSQEEQKAILLSEVYNDGENTTEDKIFLLNRTESSGTYFTYGAYRYDSRHDQMASDLKLCLPTSYIKKQGVFTSERGGCGWALRSSGNQRDKIVVIYEDGSQGRRYVDEPVCIRPALWIDLDSEIFKQSTIKGDSYKVKELKKMLAHETDECEDHYGAKLSHCGSGAKPLTIDAGGLMALIRYYETHDTKLE